MYEYDIDTTPQRRSFRVKSTVYSLVLEKCWWETFEAVCPRGETRKTWILEWIEDAKDKGCNRQALIRFRIHQLAMDESEHEQKPNPMQQIMDRIDEFRRKRVPWRVVADRLNEEGLIPTSGEWSEESVKGFYYIQKQRQ